MMQSKNSKVVLICCAFVFGMLAMSYAAVPLYDLFCRVTGYGGTTQTAEAAPSHILQDKITVRFDANILGDLNWRFKPEQTMIEARIGEVVTVNYIAENIGTARSTGTSTFNVTPLQTGSYFNKMECFCFTEQTLEKGERIIMPVIFFVDPEIVKDFETQDVKTITLSYSMFPVEQPVNELAMIKNTSIEKTSKVMIDQTTDQDF